VKLKELLSQVDEILKNEVPDRHSFFQLKHFIVDNEPTIQAKMQACLQELKTRRTSLENMTLEIQDLQDQNALLSLEVESVEADGADDPVEARRHEILARQLRRKALRNDRQIVELQRKGKSLAEECQFFVEAFNQLLSQEPLKRWDDVAVQQEYWDAKLGNTLKTRLILGLPLDEELVKAALSLPDASTTRKNVRQLIEAQQELNARAGLPEVEATVRLTGAGSDLAPASTAGSKQ
jgi:hypothetical protein